MSNFAILTDATSDLPAEFQKEYEIEVVPGHILLPDGSDIFTLPEWKYFTKEAFYKDLRKNPDGYKTSPANAGELKQKMEELVDAGKDVLMITISTGISGLYDFALQAKKMVLEDYPDAKIEVVDSLRFGPALGLLSVHASMLRSEGKTMEETTEYLEANKNRFHQAGWLDDLTFVAKKGRITQAKAFFGSLAGVKPIGEFDYNGLTTVLGKAAGKKAAYKALLTYIEETVENPSGQFFFIAESMRRPEAEEYKKMIEEKFHPKAVYIQDVHPSCGVNIGPGLMAAYYVGKPISKDLSRERGILEKALQAKE